MARYGQQALSRSQKTKQLSRASFWRSLSKASSSGWLSRAAARPRPRTGRRQAQRGRPPHPPGRSPAQLYPHFLQDDPLGVRGAAEGVGLQRRAQVGLLVLLVVPLLVAAMAAELPGGAEASALPCGTEPERDEEGRSRRRTPLPGPRRGGPSGVRPPPALRGEGAQPGPAASLPSG